MFSISSLWKRPGREQGSLVTRLESILAATMGAALLIALVLITSKELLTQRAALSEGGQAWLNTLAVQATSPLAFDDAKAAQEFLQAASIYPGLQAAYILRADGSTLASHLAASQPELSAAELARANTTPFFAGALLIATPVRLSEDMLGSVVAKIDLTRMWRSILQFAISLIVALGASGAAAALAARKFLHRALAPIKGLKQVMDDVSQGQRFTVRAEVVANDEVGALSTVFNNMLDQIIKSDSLLAENNARLRALKDAAEQASNMKSEFLALMSHELRTPMAGVLGMLKLSLRGQMDATVRERIELASQNAAVLLQLVNDLLDVSKIEAGKLSLECVDFELQTLLGDAMRLLHERAVEKGIALSWQIDAAVPAYLRGDPTRLRQVLINLVGNAIKFTERGGVNVTVRNLPPDERRPEAPPPIYFAVQDTGIGISDAAQRRMFQKFEQADMSTTRKFGGTGLGLSICKQLVELMGGQIGLHSVLDQGSIFFFELPLPPGQRPAETSVEALGRHAYRLHALVAEDASTNQLIIKALLQDMGHQVSVVENGEQALEALTRQSFDLILMDGRMPVMDGLEATAHIRAGHWRELIFADRHIPIIALTANASEQDRAKFLAGGMNDFLSKPVDELALHQVLGRVIEQRLRAGLPMKPRADDALGALDSWAANAGLTGLDGLDAPAAPPPAPLRASQDAMQQRARSVQAQMLRAFREQAPLRLQEIAAAAAAADWNTAAIVAHGIKGCLAYIEPNGSAYLLSDQLERMADQGEVAEFDARLQALGQALANTLKQDAGSGA